MITFSIFRNTSFIVAFYIKWMNFLKKCSKNLTKLFSQIWKTILICYCNFMHVHFKCIFSSLLISSFEVYMMCLGRTFILVNVSSKYISLYQRLIFNTSGFSKIECSTQNSIHSIILFSNISSLTVKFKLLLGIKLKSRLNGWRSSTWEQTFF